MSLMATAPAWLSAIGMIASVSAMMIALLALSAEDDRGAIGLTLLLMTVSAIALMIQPLLGAFSHAAMVELRLAGMPGTDE